MGTLFEIKYTGMKRKGLVAKERIRRGTRITAEKPLLQFHSHTPPALVISSAIKHLSREDHKKFFDFDNNNY